jgi:hypothetical protein
VDSTAEPPPGFEFAAADDGGCVILYRTRGMGCAARFFAIWLGTWTVGCVALANAALFQPEGINFLLLLIMVPVWAAELFVTAYVAWFFWSVTRFTFGPEQLVVERSLWRFRRCREFRRGEITAVRQIKDGGEGEDSLPSWGLAVIDRTEVRVLSPQPIEKSNWLGPVVAQWAEVAFEPCEPAKARNYETL